MLKDVTLGQYFPGNSFVHRLDPRTKLLFLIVYIVALFTADGWIAYGLILAFLITVISVSKVPLKSILSGMKPLVLILIFTGVLNIFFTPGQTVWVSVGFVNITIYYELVSFAYFNCNKINYFIAELLYFQQLEYFQSYFVNQRTNKPDCNRYPNNGKYHQ